MDALQFYRDALEDVVRAAASVATLRDRQHQARRLDGLAEELRADIRLMELNGEDT